MNTRVWGNAIGGKHLWSRGYYVVTVGEINSEEVQRYIENQEAQHQGGEIIISPY